MADREIYDPTVEFNAGDLDVALTPPQPEQRDLTAAEWGIIGEGTPEALRAFLGSLNTGHFDGIPVRIRPEFTDWGKPRLPFATAKQKPRGKALVAKVDMTAESMAHLQATIGHRQYDTPRDEFMESARPDDVERYAERFRDGDRPGPFIVELDTDGNPDGHQEGRHRALAAIRAGIKWVPVIVIRNTAGFQRNETLRKENGPGYWSDYPEET